MRQTPPRDMCIAPDEELTQSQWDRIVDVAKDMFPKVTAELESGKDPKLVFKEARKTFAKRCKVKVPMSVQIVRDKVGFIVQNHSVNVDI